jgi:hypothetical protein
MTEEHQNWLYDAACSIVTDGWTHGAQNLFKSAKPIHCTGLPNPFDQPAAPLPAGPPLPAGAPGGPAPPAPSG